MSDPLSPQEAFAAQGLAWAQDQMQRTVSIRGQSYRGVRSDLQIDPRELKPGGFQKSKRFAMTISIDQFSEIPKDGTEVTDDLGRKFKIRLVDHDAIQVTITCDNINI